MIILNKVYRQLGMSELYDMPFPSQSQGYPIVYITTKDEPVCADCASSPDNDDTIADCGVHWEGEPHHCKVCECAIGSAYGE